MDRVVSEIVSRKARLVCIQLPDGLKPYAYEISREIEARTKAKVLIWAASCFGSCDIPLIERFTDLVIQWGHSEWSFK